MADATMFLSSDDYCVEIVGSVEDSLYISDCQGSRVYVAITDQLKDRLERICQDWAFENEMAAREAEREPIVTDGDRMYGWCGRCGTSSRYVTGPFARLAVVDWLAEHEHRVHDDRPPTPTPPVCDHCGEPVEQSPGGLYWTHTTESRQGHRFACIIYGQKMHTDAAVNGSEKYLADLVPDPMDDYDPMVSGLAEDSHWGETMTGAEGFTRDRPLVAT